MPRTSRFRRALATAASARALSRPVGSCSAELGPPSPPRSRRLGAHDAEADADLRRRDRVGLPRRPAMGRADRRPAPPAGHRQIRDGARGSATRRRTRRAGRGAPHRCEATGGSTRERSRLPRRALDSRSASIAVWGFALFGSSAYRPTTQWSTSRVRLEWRGARWLITGVRSQGGPAPDFPLRELVRADRRYREPAYVP